MDGGAWKAAVHGVAEGWTQLKDFTFTFHFHALEKEMATQSTVLAWRIPGMAGPGGLPSMGSHRVGHDWSDLAAAAAKILIIILRGIGFRTFSFECSMLKKKKKLAKWASKGTEWSHVRFYTTKLWWLNLLIFMCKMLPNRKLLSFQRLQTLFLCHFPRYCCLLTFSSLVLYPFSFSFLGFSL